MDKLLDLKKAINGTYIKLNDGSYIESGDILVINYYCPRYYIAEYVKYDNVIILLLHSLFESFHFTIFNFFYASEKSRSFFYSYVKNAYKESLSLSNEELSKYLLSKNLIFKKTNLNNLSKQHQNWFMHKRKGVLYRKNWDNIPNLYLQNINLFNGSLIIQTINSSYTGVYLSSDDTHKEYIWRQNKLC